MIFERIESRSNPVIECRVDRKVVGYIKYSPRTGQYLFHPHFETSYDVQTINQIADKLKELS